MRIPGGLRVRLALAMSALTVVVLLVNFIGLREGVSGDLQEQLDTNLKSQYENLKKTALDPAVSLPEIKAAMQGYVANQGYSSSARVLAFRLVDGTEITNEQDLLHGKGAGDEQALLLSAPVGFSTVKVSGFGDFRVYTKKLIRGGKPVAICVVASPLASIEDAQQGLRSAFLVVAVLTLLLSLGVSAWIATRITRPIRRIAGIATAIDSEDLTKRIDYRGPADEVSVLADSFDRMLERLQEAFRKQRDFVSDASHELRTPLTVLRGQVELLARNHVEDPREREQTFKTLLREIDLMNRLVDDMLMLAKLDNRKSLQLRQVDITDFVEDFERDLPLLGDRIYTVQGDVSGLIEIDVDRIGQVLRNIVRNAVAHTADNGKISITFSGSSKAIEIEIKDDGPGIPQDQLELIFDRFHRTDESRNRVAGGSGLGLAIAQAIVNAHGGRIWAESAVGDGAKFKIVLPRTSA